MVRVSPSSMKLLFSNEYTVLFVTFLFHFTCVVYLFEFMHNHLTILKNDSTPLNLQNIINFYTLITSSYSINIGWMLSFTVQPARPKLALHCH